MEVDRRRARAVPENGEDGPASPPAVPRRIGSQPRLIEHLAPVVDAWLTDDRARGPRRRSIPKPPRSPPTTGSPSTCLPPAARPARAPRRRPDRPDPLGRPADGRTRGPTPAATPSWPATPHRSHPLLPAGIPRRCSLHQKVPLCAVIAALDELRIPYRAGTFAVQPGRDTPTIMNRQLASVGRSKTFRAQAT